MNTARTASTGVDKDGEKLWNQTYEIQNPEVQTCGDVAAIGGKNESTIYVVQAKNGPLGKINTNLPVRNFCVARQGVVCAVLDDEDVTWVNLYSAEGKIWPASVLPWATVATRLQFPFLRAENWFACHTFGKMREQ